MKWTKTFNSLLIARIRPGMVPSQGCNRLNEEVHITVLTSIVVTEILGLTSWWQFPYLENEADYTNYRIGLNDIKYVKNLYNV